MKEQITRREFLNISLKTIAGIAFMRLDKQIGNFTRLSSEDSVIPIEIESILNSTPKYNFDETGNLIFNGKNVPTESPANLKEKTQIIKCLIIHYDGAEPFYIDNNGFRQKRTPFMTKSRGLDPRGLSMQWCIGSGLPFLNNGTSILQTMDASGDKFYPYKRIAPSIALLETRKGKVKITNDLFSQAGITSPEWISYANEGLRSYSVGFEQIGTNFNSNFPTNMPPEQQVASSLGLIIACMKLWNLNSWDVIGHNEINNEKVDPGNIYMAIIRILIGCYALKNKDKETKLYNQVFGLEIPTDYFSKVLKYYFLANPNDKPNNSVLEKYLPINQLFNNFRP